MLRTRVLTAAAVLPVLLFLVWLGPPYFTLLVGLASLVGHLEFYHLARLGGLSPLVWVGTAGGLGVVGAVGLGRPELAGPGLAAEALLAGAVLVVGGRTRGALADWAATLGGSAYCGLIFSHYILLRDLPHGLEWTLLTFGVTFAVDTAAFFAGRRWGRRPLAPAVSPAKTVEGFVAGLAAGPLVALGMAALLGLPASSPVAFLGFGLGLAGQVGDLFESALKRSAGVKDSGRLFPGHGGLLDRVDSLAFNGIVSYYILDAFLPAMVGGG
ncbi:MAG: phosphatidate cytidylyltransferase [Chloroflexota bacterium]